MTVVVLVVVITIMQHQRKLASILWPPSHTQWGSHQAVAVRQLYTTLYFMSRTSQKSDPTGNNIIHFLDSNKSSISIRAVPGNKVLHLAVLSHVQHEGGVAGPLTCQALWRLRMLIWGQYWQPSLSPHLLASRQSWPGQHQALQWSILLNVPSCQLFSPN